MESFKEEQLFLKVDKSQEAIYREKPKFRPQSAPKPKKSKFEKKQVPVFNFVDFDGEKLYEKFQTSKVEIKFLSEENTRLKTKVQHLVSELGKRDETIEQLSSNMTPSLNASFKKIANLNSQLRTSQKARIKLEQDIEKLRKKYKITKIQELESELSIYSTEWIRLKSALEQSIQETKRIPPALLKSQHDQSLQIQSLKETIATQSAQIEKQNSQITEFYLDNKTKSLKKSNKRLSADLRKATANKRAFEEEVTKQKLLIRKLEFRQKEFDVKSTDHECYVKHLQGKIEALNFDLSEIMQGNGWSASRFIDREQFEQEFMTLLKHIDEIWSREGIAIPAQTLVNRINDWTIEPFNKRIAVKIHKIVNNLPRTTFANTSNLALRKTTSLPNKGLQPHAKSSQSLNSQVQQSFQSTQCQTELENSNTVSFNQELDHSMSAQMIPMASNMTFQNEYVPVQEEYKAVQPIQYFPDRLGPMKSVSTELDNPSQPGQTPIQFSSAMTYVQESNKEQPKIEIQENSLGVQRLDHSIMSENYTGRLSETANFGTQWERMLKVEHVAQTDVSPSQQMDRTQASSDIHSFNFSEACIQVDHPISEGLSQSEVITQVDYAQVTLSDSETLKAIRPETQDIGLTQLHIKSEAASQTNLEMYTPSATSDSSGQIWARRQTLSMSSEYKPVMVPLPVQPHLQQNSPQASVQEDKSDRPESLSLLQSPPQDSISPLKVFETVNTEIIRDNIANVEQHQESISPSASSEHSSSMNRHRRKTPSGIMNQLSEFRDEEDVRYPNRKNENRNRQEITQSAVVNLTPSSQVEQYQTEDEPFESYESSLCASSKNILLRRTPSEVSQEPIHHASEVQQEPVHDPPEVSQKPSRHASEHKTSSQYVSSAYSYSSSKNQIRRDANVSQQSPEQGSVHGSYSAQSSEGSMFSSSQYRARRGEAEVESEHIEPGIEHVQPSSSSKYSSDKKQSSQIEHKSPTPFSKHSQSQVSSQNTDRLSPAAASKYSQSKTSSLKEDNRQRKPSSKYSQSKKSSSKVEQISPTSSSKYSSSRNQIRRASPESEVYSPIAVSPITSSKQSQSKKSSSMVSNKSPTSSSKFSQSKNQIRRASPELEDQSPKHISPTPSSKYSQNKKQQSEAEQESLASSSKYSASQNQIRRANPELEEESKVDYISPVSSSKSLHKKQSPYVESMSPSSSDQYSSSRNIVRRASPESQQSQPVAYISSAATSKYSSSKKQSSKVEQISSISSSKYSSSKNVVRRASQESEEINAGSQEKEVFTRSYTESSSCSLYSSSQNKVKRGTPEDALDSLERTIASNEKQEQSEKEQQSLMTSSQGSLYSSSKNFVKRQSPNVDEQSELEHDFSDESEVDSPRTQLTSISGFSGYATSKNVIRRGAPEELSQSVDLSQRKDPVPIQTNPNTPSHSSTSSHYSSTKNLVRRREPSSKSSSKLFQPSASASNLGSISSYQPSNSMHAQSPLELKPQPIGQVFDPQLCTWQSEASRTLPSSIQAPRKAIASRSQASYQGSRKVTGRSSLSNSSQSEIYSSQQWRARKSASGSQQKASSRPGAISSQNSVSMTSIPTSQRSKQFTSAHAMELVTWETPIPESWTHETRKSRNESKSSGAEPSLYRQQRRSSRAQRISYRSEKQHAPKGTGDSDTSSIASSEADSQSRVNLPRLPASLPMRTSDSYESDYTHQFTFTSSRISSK